MVASLAAPHASGRLADLPPPEVVPLVHTDPVSRQHTLHLLIDGAHCGACVRRIERAVAAVGGLEAGRLNLTTRRLTLRWTGDAQRAADYVHAVQALGYRAVPFDPQRLDGLDDHAERALLRCLAVAGFAAGNVMLLAVSVWAGHFHGMGAGTRTFFHWVQALIALPAIAYAGQPFFRSAWAALRHGRTNMDVPISLGVTIAAAMSLHETIRGAEHAYFDSAVTLLFFLLIGRFLDQRARGAARGAAQRLLALRSSAVTLVLPDGSTRAVRPEAVEAGQEILVAAGERVGVDGTVRDGHSEVDTSVITGETVPQAVGPGAQLFAGTVNLAAPLRLTVRATGEGTLLAEIVRLMELAEQRRGRFVVLADRVARLYAPIVHTLALATFLGWLVLSGIDWQTALLYAVAVLIITCPCALGLAVPAVQVIASARLMQRGVLLKSATALERFAQADMVVFDKTGTLTEGHLDLRRGAWSAADLAAAAGLAKVSRHPLARALAAACPTAPAARGVEELPGCGLRLITAQGEWRLGRRGWAGPAAEDESAGPELWLARPGHPPVRFAFVDRLRDDARTVVDGLRAAGLAVGLLSGDRAATVAETATLLGIDDWHAAQRPADKVARLEALRAQGRRVLMVGDGLNDAPALAAATVSLSPASAADISQTAADAVFQGAQLRPVLDCLHTARRAERLVRQNIAISMIYNVATVPLAVAGFVTPLIAAISMSASSLLVVGNALRLHRR
jgi:Cu2+-exporting ATPase